MKNRKFITAILSLVLVLAATVGITIAYFTDYESGKGGAKLTLKGETWIDEKADDNSKDIVIQNVGETEMIVRVRVYGDASHLTIADEQSGWILGSDGYYYYNKILKPDPAGRGNGDRSTTLHAEIKVSGEEDIEDFDIIVTHESSLVIYDGTDAGNIICPSGWDSAAVAQIQAQ